MRHPRNNYASFGIRVSEFSDTVYETVSKSRFRGIPIGLQYRQMHQIEGLSVEIAARSTVE